MRAMRQLRGVALLALGLSAGGCAQAGPLGDILTGVLNPQGSGEQLVQGDVQVVDTNRQYVQVRTSAGQVANVRFDNRTQVVYQQRTYPVTALERGDRVSIRVQQTQQGELYTDQILVTQSIQETGGTGGQTASRQYMQMDGYVGQVDAQRGLFELRQQNRASIWVSLPYNSSSTTVSRFQRLRNGEYVRVGGYMIANDRLELQSFL